MRIKPIVTQALLIFVWVSVGFSVGKHATLRTVQIDKSLPAEALAPEDTPRPPSPGSDAMAPAERNTPESLPIVPVPNHRVVVHYIHGNIRCVTCNNIETLTRKVLEEDFADPLADGSLIWKMENFQRDPEVARRYDVTGSSVVLAREAQGEEVAFRILEEVWLLESRPELFRQFIQEAITEYLSQGEGA